MDCKLRVAYLRGRPDGHPIHNAYAQSIGATFHYIDEAARWHDLSLSAPVRYWRWIQNARAFPYDRYDALLIEGPHIWPPLAGRLLRKPVWALIGDQTLYFLHSGFYRASTRQAITFALRRYTGLFVIGEMLERLARTTLGASTPPLYVGFNGVDESRLEKLLRITPALEKPVIALLAHGEDGWRTHYKGLDLFVETMSLLKPDIPGLRGIVIGRWSARVQKELLSRFPGAPVEFLGPVQDVNTVLAEVGLYFHPARGEAWGIAVQEALAAGIPAIVSEWTGTAEVVSQIWEGGIVSLSVTEAAERILRYFDMPLSEKKALSEKGRWLIQSRYTRRQAIERFQELFHTACQSLGL